MKNAQGTSGTQAIERAITLLTTVASRPETGWRLTDLARYCELNNSTTHRILATLIERRLVKRREADRRYVSGPMLYDLALTLPAHFEFQSACHPRLHNLARQVKARVFLALRSGSSYVCIDSLGTGDVRLLSRPGTRRPLIGAAMGCAILITLPEEVQSKIVESNIREIRLHEERYLDAHLHTYRRSRRCGFGYHKDDVLHGLTCLSLPILREDATAFASISVITGTGSLTHADIRNLVELLRKEAQTIAQEHGALIESI